MTLERPIGETEHFKVHDGPLLPSLLALRAYLRMIPQRQFDHHVGHDHNDFAEWVDHVFGEKELAQRMRRSRTREEIAWLIDDAFAEERMRKVIAGNEVAAKAAPIPGVESADPVVMQEDTSFDPYKPGISGNNERISAKYDDVAKHLQEAIANPVPRDVERRIDALRTRCQEVTGRISEARKSRHDALIPALVMKQFQPKLAMAIATREEKDFKAADAVLDEAEAELKELLEEKIIDVKAEVLALAGVEEKPKK